MIRFVPLVVVCLIATPAVAQDQGGAPRTVGAWNPANIRWQVESEDGTKWAVLEGRRDVPGEAFTYAFLLPGGYWEHHWHASDARVAVVRGALRVSFGHALDSLSAQAYPVGTFLLVPANTQHTMGAEVETIIIGTAVGPWATHRHPANQKH